MEKSCSKLKRLLMFIAGMALALFMFLDLSGSEAYDPQAEEF